MRDELPIILLFLVAVLVISYTWKQTVSVYKHGAIERGYAIYCPDDGKWAWKGECDKDPKE